MHHLLLAPLERILINEGKFDDFKDINDLKKYLLYHQNNIFPHIDKNRYKKGIKDIISEINKKKKKKIMN